MKKLVETQIFLENVFRPVEKQIVPHFSMVRSFKRKQKPENPNYQSMKTEISSTYSIYALMRNEIVFV